MSKKLGWLILIITFLSMTALLIIPESSSKNTSNNEENSIIDNINKNNTTKENIIGNYKVQEDKKSILNINEDGTYEIHINVCEGYLEVSGEYEIIDKKLKLLNESKFEKYPSLYENYEFSFTIIDDDTLRLDEDLVCLFQNTLFER